MARPSDVFTKLTAAGRKVFIPFFTGLFPDRQVFRDLLLRADDAGADWIEIGVPFSDPLADGKLIRYADRWVLERGFSFIGLLEELDDMRDRLRAGYILLAYCNTVFKRAPYALSRLLVNAGISGIVVPDLPLEESAALDTSFWRAGLDLIPMVAPTTSEERISAAGERKGGFIYLVALTGLTGIRDRLPKGLGRYVLSVKQATAKPLCIGFGISTPEQAEKAGRLGDGVIVGSALLQIFPGYEKDISAVRKAGTLMKNIRRSLDGI